VLKERQGSVTNFRATSSGRELAGGLGSSSSREMLHHQDRARAETKMICKFNLVDNQFAGAQAPPESDSASVRSSKSLRSSVLNTVSPGRYSASRLREDQNSARTINPNHEYYISNDYHDKNPKTFGSLKAGRMPSVSVVMGDTQ
jgi:hypothetical protein